MLHNKRIIARYIWIPTLIIAFGSLFYIDYVKELLKGKISELNRVSICIILLLGIYAITDRVVTFIVNRLLK